eukprot:181174-Lingulodinium_polyedra.AAC.1
MVHTRRTAQTRMASPQRPAGNRMRNPQSLVASVRISAQINSQRGTQAETDEQIVGHRMLTGGSLARACWRRP